MSDERLACARSFREVMGDAFADAWEANRQRALAEKAAEAAPELSATVVEFCRSREPGWQARLSADLEDLVRIKQRSA